MAPEGARYQEGEGRASARRCWRYRAGIKIAARKSWITPGNLLALVKNTAPFLFRGDGASVSGPPWEFVSRLRAAAVEGPTELPLLDYFKLCLAAHYATVATFVPTDVDTKIRKALWSESEDRELLRAMCDYALGAASWDLSLVSRRITTVKGAGPISGHDGEWLSVLAGAHGRFVSLEDAEYAEKTAAAIDAELSREAAGFRTAFALPGAELDVLRLAASLTHNCGDLDQGISSWGDGSSGDATSISRSRFHRLAHENRTPYSGTFQIAARLYREAMAAEGHRHYPLRGVKALRQDPGLLLPLGPFLDDWGAVVATHPLLSSGDRAEIVAALVSGCRKVPNQLGYYRALAGFAAAAPRMFENASASLPATVRRELRDLQKQIGVQRASFESMMRKKVASVRYTVNTDAV